MEAREKLISLIKDHLIEISPINPFNPDTYSESLYKLIIKEFPQITKKLC